MKKRLLKALSEMKKVFSENEEALSAIDVLTKFTKEIEEETKKTEDFFVPQEFQNQNSIVLYSDGACRGNPGPGSYACIGQNQNSEILFTEADVDSHTTNNKMEMKGAIRALEIVEESGLTYERIALFTDSKYVVDGIQKWVPSWKQRGWKKADKKEPENLELWKRLDELNQNTKVEFYWVKGHAGHPQNEFCDRLANEALDNEGF